MKINLLFYLFLSINIYAQNMNLQTFENKLGTEIPNDYLIFRGTDLQNENNLDFHNDTYLFWNIETCVEKTLNLRKSGVITEKAFAFAVDKANTVYFYDNSIKSSSKISYFDEDKDLTLFVFSLTEFINYEKTRILIDELESVDFEKQNLTDIMDCPGSIFKYATQLMTSEYDKDFSKKRNKKAIELFFIAAEKGHPDAATEIANYYYYQKKVDINKVIEWREKAIKYGNIRDIYELADFIIDEKIEEIDKSILLLESLLVQNTYKERAMLKLSRIYMRGTGGKLNYEKGLEYVRNCAELNNYNALSDLAFYYYNGKGVEKDVQKAYDLLLKSEKIVIEKTGKGNWGDFINQLKNELETKK